jgi:hypothetical protein
MLIVDMKFVKNQQLMDFGVTAFMNTVVKIALQERVFLLLKSSRLEKKYYEIVKALKT